MTAPFLLDNLFAIAARKKEEYLALENLTPFYRVFSPSGNTLDISDSRSELESELARANPIDARLVEPFLKVLQPFCQNKLKEKQLMDFVDASFENGGIQKAFHHFPLMFDANPFYPGSACLLYAYLTQRWGGYYVRGGIGNLGQALASFFMELGGEILYRNEVSELIYSNEKAVGVRLAGGTILRADYFILATHLLKDKTPIRADPVSDSSPKVFTLCFGTRRKVPGQGLIQNNFIALKNIAPVFGKFTPMLHVEIPSLNDGSIAPPDCEAFITRLIVPALDKENDWNRLARKYRGLILDTLEEQLIPDFRVNIVVEYLAPPRSLSLPGSTREAEKKGKTAIRQGNQPFIPFISGQKMTNVFSLLSEQERENGIAGALAEAVVIEKLVKEQV